MASNDIRRAQDIPNDYNAEQQWGMSKIQAPAAWDVTTGSRNGPLIAVLDTGAEMTHPDLKNNLWTNPKEVAGNGVDDDGNGVVDDIHGYDATKETGDPTDDYGHGTHCFGVIAAEGNNGAGVAGLNWQARVMPVKMMTKGEGSVAETVRALLYATKMGADITSNSYAGPYSQPEYEAFAASPALHVCAAGNDHRDNDTGQFYPDGDAWASYPATYPFDNIISVAATDRNDRLSSFSNFGAKTVDLAAPGNAILSTWPGGGYKTDTGTSMAAPHVTGVAGLIKTRFPEATPEQIKTRILANVDVVPGLNGKMVSGGRLNAARALEVDEIPPDAPPAGADEVTSHTAAIHWTHTADDGSSGAAATSTLIRWTDADGRDRRFQTGAGLPGTPGAAKLDLFPNSDARKLQFQVFQGDNVGNLSAPSVVEVTVPAAQVAALDWQTDGKWGQVNLPGRPAVWTDSPEGNYANNENSALTTKPFTVPANAPQLSFDTRHRLEPMSDGVDVEITTGDGKWKKLQDYTSYSEWKSEKIDLSAFAGKQAQLRFRIHSDSVKNDEGIYLDRICVAGE